MIVTIECTKAIYWFYYTISFIFFKNLQSIHNTLENVLGRLTRSTGIDFHYIFRGGSWVFFEQTIGSVVSLLQAIAFANLVSPNAYGTYSLALSWVGIFSTFAIGGLPNALIKSMAQGNDGELQHGLKLRLRYGLISAFLALCFSFYYLWRGDYMLTASFLVISILLPLNLSFSLVSGFFTANGYFSRRFVTEVTVGIVTLIALFCVIQFSEYVPFILLTLFGVPTIVYGLFFLYALRLKKNNTTDPRTEKFAWHLTGMSAMGTVYKNLDQILMFHTIGSAELAIYKFALIPIRKIQNFFQIVLDIALPRFAKREYVSLYKDLNKKLLLAGVGSVAVVAVYIFTAPYLFAIFFPVYKDSVPFSVLLALPLMLTPFSFIQQIWIAKSEVKRLYYFKIFSDSSRVILFIILIPMFGVAGAVWTRVIVAGAASVVTLTMYLLDKRKYAKG